MKKAIRTTGLIFAALLAGCGTPHAQKLPAVSLDCRVVASGNLTPVDGAEVIWSYVAPSGETVDFGPFRTDRNGECRIVVLPQELRPIHAIDYMAGGFYRAVRVSAPGYGTRTWREGDLRERIDESVIRPVEFRLSKEPNKTPEPMPGLAPSHGSS